MEGKKKLCCEEARGDSLDRLKIDSNVLCSLLCVSVSLFISYYGIIRK